ncbi:7,8-didemethyl-8-hydroxy-5-deazariboflavin synthase subunit CofG [Methanogenium cariaci]
MQRRVVTFSRNAFLPLTTVCCNSCGYCCFKKPPQAGCIMSPDAVREVLQHSARMGCTEALFTFGERPNEVPEFAPYLADIGYTDFLEYCYDMCREALALGMLPHTNAGILTGEEMKRLREVNASMGLMLETTATVPAHHGSPGKAPEVRIGMMEEAGKLNIPFTTGILIGIGETPEDRIESLEVIRDLHRRYGHIQEVIIQNFCPKEGTPMEAATYPGTDEMCSIIRHAREILPEDVMVQVPPNLADASDLVSCGVDDLGGVSPVTIDYVNPEHPWPQIDELKAVIGNNILKERLCIYQRFVDKGWYDDRLNEIIQRLSKTIEIRNRTEFGDDELHG